MRSRLKNMLASASLGPIFLILAFSVSANNAVVEVSNPWVRASVPGQHATGAFMVLHSAQAARLVAAETPTGRAEIHTMHVQDGIMRMRQIPYLELPPGQPVELGPGGYHLMLMDLKAPLVAGTKTPITLIIEQSGEKQRIQINAEVRPLNDMQTPKPMKPIHQQHLLQHHY